MMIVYSYCNGIHI